MAVFNTPTRKIHNRGRLRVIGQFFSHKNGKSIAWESQVERDFFFLLEFTSDVAQYTHQPETFDIWVEGVKRRYTPDVLVIDVSAEIRYKEIKYDAPEPGSKEAIKLLGAIESFIEKGYPLDVVTRTDIRKGELINNLHLLYRYAKWETNERLMREVKGFLRNNQQTRLWKLVAHFGNHATGPILRAIYEKDLLADLISAPLDHSSIVELATA